MLTPLCIDSTGRAGYEFGNKMMILSDCTFSPHARGAELLLQ